MTEPITYLQTGGAGEYTDKNGRVIAVKPVVPTKFSVAIELHVFIPKEEWDAMEVVYEFCSVVKKSELERDCATLFRTKEIIAEEVIELALWCTANEGKEGWGDAVAIVKDELEVLREELQAIVTVV